MKEQLVSLDIAKLAKEKGFDVPTYGKYLSTSEGYEVNEYLRHINGHRNYPSDDYSAPTQSLLQKWLREVHEIYLLVERAEITGRWDCALKRDGRSTTWLDCKPGDQYKTYEEALEAGLQEALKLI
jgi:hypothetical protein